MSASGVSSGAPRRRSSASGTVKPSSTSPSRARRRGSSARVMTISSPAAPIAPATFSRSSTTIRSAVRLPMPGTDCRRATSPEATAVSSSRGEPPLSTASATFGPTDCTPMSARKRSRSSSVAKPKSASASSRTTRWLCSATVAPTAGTWRSVSAETARR